jgi:hypothetical protein
LELFFKNASFSFQSPAGDDMALWAKVQQLTGDAWRCVQSSYGTHFPIDVRYFLADWIERQPW